MRVSASNFIWLAGGTESGDAAFAEESKQHLIRRLVSSSFPRTRRQIQLFGFYAHYTSYGLCEYLHGTRTGMSTFHSLVLII